jgi:hypothetical protein
MPPLTRKILLTLGLAAAGFAGGALLAWVLVIVVVWVLPIHPFIRDYPWLIGGGIGMLLGGWWAQHAVRPGRLILITLALMATGFVAGGLAGTVMMAAWRPYPDDLFSAGLFGGVVGAALGPLLAWGLMRHVPLWKALAGTWLGTVGGWMLGIVIGTWEDGFALSQAGFVASALVLRFATARGRHAAAAASPRT